MTWLSRKLWISDGGSKEIVDVTKGNVVGGRREAGAGAKYEGRDVEESGLELAGKGDKQSIVEAPLKSNDS